MKSKKGITLIALIITIIELLIIAGVPMSLELGNGVIDQAQKASQKTDLLSAQSALEVSLSLITREFLKEKWENNKSLNIYDEITIAQLDEELQNNGYYIVKFGGDSVGVNTDKIDEKVIKDDVDPDRNHTMTGTSSKEAENPYVETTIVIAKGTPGDGDHSNIKDGDTTNSKAKETTYSTKLKWTATEVTIIEELKEGSEVGEPKE